MKKDKKFLTMANNYTNGNLSDFKAELKKLSKIKLLEFILFFSKETRTTANDSALIVITYLQK